MIYVAIAVIFLVVGVIFRDPLIGIINNIYIKSLLVKGYWIFSIFFLVFIFISYFIIFKYSKEINIDRNLSILNHLSTLLFAIFVGYYAFLQIAENRIEKYAEKGMLNFRNGFYKRAKDFLEKAHQLNSKDIDISLNLGELYLITGDDKGFKRILIFLNKHTDLDFEYKLSRFYLKIANYLIREELISARTELKNMILISKNRNIKRLWNFREIKESNIYKNLDGESKMIFENLIKYLENNLSQCDKKCFEENDFSFQMKKLNGNV